MQMQPINPLNPLMTGIKETRPENGGNFIGSLLSIHRKSDSIRNQGPGSKTKQDDELTPATPPETGAIADTQQMPAMEFGGQIAAAANEERQAPDDESFPAVAGETASVLANPAAVQSQFKIILPDGQHKEEAVLTDSPVGTSLQQPVAENQKPKTDWFRQPTVDAKQAIANVSVPRVGSAAAAPENGPPPSAVTGAESLSEQPAASLPQDAKIIQLQVQSGLPHPPPQPTTLPGRIITTVADNANIRDPQAANPINLRFVELIQNMATGEPGQTSIQADTAVDLTDTLFAGILGHAIGSSAETISMLVPLRQRTSWTPGRVGATVTGYIGQETETKLPGLKISEQFLAENRADGPGKDNLGTQTASIEPAAPHRPGAGEIADFTRSLIPASDAPANGIIGQNGSAGRLPPPMVAAGHQMIDNVIQQVSLRTNHDQSNISIRLHPEELGHLKMDLVANNENIKAHIHVQTQLTREILEKCLPRLREGFAQQGLILDEIQVSVGSDTSGGSGLFNDQRTLHARPSHANTPQTRQPREKTVIAETMVAPFRSDGSISLRI